jgi:hypothetical protein
MVPANWELGAGKRIEIQGWLRKSMRPYLKKTKEK